MKPSERTCVIKSCEPTCRDGLLIEGIATTRGWGSSEVPLAFGLKTVFGKTTRQTWGLDPREMENEPPFPLLWRHDWSKRIGQVFRTYATRDALHFNAVVAPAGAEGFDGELLNQVWADVRSGVAGAVSFDTRGAVGEDGGPWQGVELSVSPKGANPFARITRAVFPDGFQLYADLPDVDEYVTRDVSVKFYGRDRQVLVQKEESPPMRYQGPWREGVTYAPGHVVTRSGLLWHANETTTAKPGTGAQFTMMLKSEEHR